MSEPARALRLAGRWLPYLHGVDDILSLVLAEREVYLAQHSLGRILRVGVDPKLHLHLGVHRLKQVAVVGGQFVEAAFEV